MTATVLVTGGTGTLGRLTTPLLRDTGFKVRVLSRGSHEAADGIEYAVGDLTTGEGIDAAVAGVDTIVHLAGDAKGDDEKARTLVKAVKASGGKPHIVYISVVGADQESFAYFGFKRGAEQVIAESGLPWTTVRATQFNDLVLTLAKTLTKLPVVPVPTGFRVQPIDARDVAARLVELAQGEPSGLVSDIAGPKIYTLKEIIASYLKATNRRRPLLPIHFPGKASRAFRTGINLAPAHATGTHTWESFLIDRLR
ncbi:SDR family oxidoreductase [Kribbella sp. NPDC051620]|uniref:SDR family oxidoreductase n=1 Tax=Kribbella sp. NPDC051620 TaxID=3364120 RepID=UPI0037B1E80B